MPNRHRETVNDLDMKQWRQYDDLLTDSLWIQNRRDATGAHQAGYHGNFIPQIPNQLLRRFTKPGEIVLDPFAGSGTAAIEAARLGRRYIGIELSPETAEQARRSAARHPAAIVAGDSAAPQTAKAIARILAGMDSTSVQLIILHPPYHNIIKFGNDPADLSNCPDPESFLQKFLEVHRNTEPFLAPGRHLALVIGDIYSKGRLIPLQNMLTSALLAEGNLKLKSLIVKNIANNRAKRNLERLWRYRALAGGFYVFKHEYIALFRKNADLPRMSERK